MVVCLWVKGCLPSYNPTLPAHTRVVLPEDTAAIITMQRRQLMTQDKQGIKVKYVPDGSTTTVIIKKDGRVDVFVKSSGFVFRPVAGILATAHLRIAGGFQFFYWNRWEGYIGGAGPVPVAWIGVGYRLDRLNLYNTSLAVSYTSRKEIGGSLLWRF